MPHTTDRVDGNRERTDENDLEAHKLLAEIARALEGNVEYYLPADLCRRIAACVEHRKAITR